MSNNEKLPYIKYVTTFIVSAIIILILSLWLTFYLKYMFYNPKIKVPENQYELNVDFNKIWKLQAAYFALNEPKRFEAQDKFKIYDTELMQSVSDTIYKVIVTGDLIKRKETEIISWDKLKIQNQKASLKDLQNKLKNLKENQ